MRQLWAGRYYFRLHPAGVPMTLSMAPQVLELPTVRGKADIERIFHEGMEVIREAELR